MKTLVWPALALALALPAVAVEVDNPACALLTEDDATEAFGRQAREHEITPEMTGASDCGWLDVKENAISLNLGRGMAFQGQATATDGYRAARKDYDSGGVREDIEGIGEAAFVFTPQGAKPGAYYNAGVLQRASVVTMTTYGLSKGETLRLLALAARRIEVP